MKRKIKLYSLIMTVIMMFTCLTIPTQAAENSKVKLSEFATKDEHKLAYAQLFLEVNYPVDNNSEFYTKVSYSSYEKALDYANYLLDNWYTIKDRDLKITTSLEFIKVTKAALTLEDNVNDTDKDLNLAKLKFNILKLSQLDKDDYTDDSWFFLEAAIKNAEESLDAAYNSETLLANIYALKGIMLYQMEKINDVEVCKVFSDVKHKAWYEDGVQFVYDYGFMSGSNGLFKPTDDITRAQLVTTLYRLIGSPKVTSTKALIDFSDVEKGKYYTDAICWAYANGIATGNGGKFNPSSPLTRQQMATFFYRFSDYMELDITAKGDVTEMLNVDQLSDYAKDAMEWAVGTGIITGSEVNVNGVTMKDLKPRGNTTRAQVATIIMRFCYEN